MKFTGFYKKTKYLCIFLKQGKYVMFFEGFGEPTW